MRTAAVMGWLGYSGLLPFYAAALWALMPGPDGDSLAARVFVVYGVVILAFLGGSLWGNAVARPIPEKHHRLLISNLVALFAAVAGLVGELTVAVLLLALGQLTLLAYERSTGRQGWYLSLRTRLTLGVLPAHLLMFMGAMGAA